MSRYRDLINEIEATIVADLTCEGCRGLIAPGYEVRNGDSVAHHHCAVKLGWIDNGGYPPEKEPR